MREQLADGARTTLHAGDGTRPVGSPTVFVTEPSVSFLLQSHPMVPPSRWISGGYDTARPGRSFVRIARGYQMKYSMLFGCLTAAFTVTAAAADDGRSIKTVFVIAMENHNWTQPANQFSGPIQQIFQNPNAPFINSLVNGTAVATINGRQVHISEQVAYATNYRSVLATAGGNNPHIHPSEPNYIWAEAGFNFNIFNDADPFTQNGGPTVNQVNNLDNQLHLVGLLTQA